MEKILDKLQPQSRLKIKVTPKALREAADRMETEAKQNCLPGQEVELAFSRTVTLVYEPEPEGTYYTSVSSEERHPETPVLN